MHYADFSRGFVLCFDPNEKFHETLLRFFNQKRFPSAFYQGIGTLNEVKLALYDSKNQDYKEETLSGDYELISIMGNISLVEGNAFPHSHVCLGDAKGATISGRLLEATVSSTAEIFLIPIDIALLRKEDSKLSLKTLDLPHHFVESI